MENRYFYGWFVQRIFNSKIHNVFYSPVLSSDSGIFRSLSSSSMTINHLKQFCDFTYETLLMGA